MKLKKYEHVVEVIAQSELDEIRNRRFRKLDDFKEAIVEFSKIDQRLDIQKIQVRFLIGAFAQEMGRQYGAGLIEQLAEEHHLSATTIREARQFARKLKMSPNNLKLWLERQMKNNKRVYWTDVQGFIKANSDPKVIGPAKMVNRVTSKAENLGQDLERLNDVLDELPEEEALQYQEELDSAVGATMQELRRFHAQSSKVDQADRRGPPRSRDYLKFVAQFPCPVSGEWPVQVHHAIGRKGTSGKASDFGAVPLSAELHTELHTIGINRFQKKHGISFRRLVMNYQHYYITEQWLDMDLGEPQKD